MPVEFVPAPIVCGLAGKLIDNSAANYTLCYSSQTDFVRAANLLGVGNYAVFGVCLSNQF